MTKTFLSIAFICFSRLLFGQTYHTPSKIMFAGMELRLSDALRKDIQAEVDALSRNPKYLNIKLDRAMLYFPLIERIFSEENLPEDFKYLVIQESGLMPDAISTSNAVGFWQFKKEAALEVGLRLDGGVDERMNIISSTRGAARYLKSHNIFFDNWLYSLLGYYAGRGGAEKIVDKKYYGSRIMNLDRNLHWYVKKFLAHKVVFENALQGYPSPGIYLYEYSQTANKSLKDIARDFSVSEAEIYEYNKWLKRDKAPLDKIYTVIVPLKAPVSQVVATTVAAQNEAPQPGTVRQTRSFEQAPEYPKIEEFLGFDAYHVKINGKHGVFARNETDNVNSLALIANISVDRFRRLNDLGPDDEIKTGHVYYLQPKYNKARTHFHVLQPDEDLWHVSQKYGLKLNKLMQKNRIRNQDEVLKPGMVLWLRFIRPKSHPVEYSPVQYARQEHTAIVSQEKAQQPKPIDHEERTNTEPVSLAVIEVPVAPTETEKPVPPPVIERPVEQPKTETPVVVEAHQETIKAAPTKNTASPSNGSSTPSTVDKSLPTTHSVATVEISETNTSIDPKRNITHTVKQGETLYSISRTYEVPLSQLLSLNSLSLEDGIKIGQELTVYRAGTASYNEQTEQSNLKTYIYHKVQAGETLYRIARQYNVTIQEIMEWNNKSDFNVSIGENIRVSK
jgi:membrane-bound lytic murein transglycosylase D